MENKYLVYRTEHFYDGHGEEADGESQYFIVDEEDGYQNLDPNLRYSEELEEREELYEQDGYHTTAYSFEVTLLDEASAELADDYLTKINWMTAQLGKMFNGK